MTVLVYFHGFNSSGQSDKSKEIAAWAKNENFDFRSFNYNSFSYIKAMFQIKSNLDQIIKEFPNEELIFIGTSLGGFYASHFANQFLAKTLLLNPSVTPFSDLNKYVNVDMKNFYTEETKTLKLEDIEGYRWYKFKPQYETIIMLEKGDDQIPYENTLNFVKNNNVKAEVRVFEGGSHRFENKEEIFKAIRELDGRFAFNESV